MSRRLQVAIGSARTLRISNSVVSVATRALEIESALAKLGKDFVRASHYCCNSGCNFSYKIDADGMDSVAWRGNPR